MGAVHFELIEPVGVRMYVNFITGGGGTILSQSVCVCGGGGIPWRIRAIGLIKVIFMLGLLGGVAPLNPPLLM